MYAIKANITVCCILLFILSYLICQNSSCTLPSPQFPCCHLLATGITVSKQYWYWVWQPIRVLPSTQYYPILENIGQYPIPQCRYRSNLKCTCLVLTASVQVPNTVTDCQKMWHLQNHSLSMWLKIITQ